MFNMAVLAEHQGEVEALAGQALTVVVNKSRIGLQALLDHRANLAMMSGTLGNQIRFLAASGGGQATPPFQVYLVTRSLVVLVVHPSNPVRSLGIDQLRRVLSGAVANWLELGGPDLPIRLVATREGGAVISTLEAKVLGIGRHASIPNQIRVQNGTQVAKVVEQEPGALGIATEQDARHRSVAELAMPETMELDLDLVSLGEPTTVMMRVIAACREIAAKDDL